MLFDKKGYFYNIYSIFATLPSLVAVNYNTYCEFNTCTVDQYCCDTDTCCHLNSGLHHGVIIAVIILLMCGVCLCYKYSFLHHLRRYITKKVFARSDSERHILVEKV